MGYVYATTPKQDQNVCGAVVKKLNHQTVPDHVATQQYVRDNTGQGDTCFVWNREDTSQLDLVDPLDQGWTLFAVPAEGTVPGYLELRAPEAWENSVGPVFVLVKAPVFDDRDIVSTHDFVHLDCTQSLGNLDRFAGPDDYAAAVWERGPNMQTELNSLVVAAGVPVRVFECPSVAQSPGIVRTHSTCYSGMYGCGPGYIAGHGIHSGESEGCFAGFAVVNLSLDGSGGGESVRIFDLVIKRSSGGS